MEYILRSPLEMAALGEKMAAEAVPVATAFVIALRGQLGSGKTTFIQGFGRGLGIEEPILSPTFVIMNRYPLKDRKFRNFYHFDCYRLKGEDDLGPLGFNEVIADPRNIVCIEWPERIEKALPEGAVEVFFDVSGEGERKVKIERHGGQ